MQQARVAPPRAAVRALFPLALAAALGCQAKAATTTSAVTLPQPAVEPLGPLVLTVGGKPSVAFSWSGGQVATLSTATGGGGTSAGKPTLAPIAVTRAMDAQSPALFAALVAGTHYPSAYVEQYTQTETGWRRYLVVALEDVLVKSISASSGGDAPLENVELVYGKYSITWDDGTGPVTRCWDVAQNTGC